CISEVALAASAATLAAPATCDSRLRLSTQLVCTLSGKAVLDMNARIVASGTPICWRGLRLRTIRSARGVSHTQVETIRTPVIAIEPGTATDIAIFTPA